MNRTKEDYLNLAKKILDTPTIPRTQQQIVVGALEDQLRLSNEDAQIVVDETVKIIENYKLLTRRIKEIRDDYDSYCSEGNGTACAIVCELNELLEQIE